MSVAESLWLEARTVKEKAVQIDIEQVIEAQNTSLAATDIRNLGGFR